MNTTENKPVAPREMLEKIVLHMLEAPDSQASRAAISDLNKAVELGLHNFTDLQLYELVQGVTRFFNSGDISSFTMALCDLDKFYSRPTS